VQVGLPPKYEVRLLLSESKSLSASGRAGTESFFAIFVTYDDLSVRLSGEDPEDLILPACEEVAPPRRNGQPPNPNDQSERSGTTRSTRSASLMGSTLSPPSRGCPWHFNRDQDKLSNSHFFHTIHIICQSIENDQQNKHPSRGTEVLIWCCFIDQSEDPPS
jgi:hypothetical protein